jgi:hypothetical protein
LGHGVFSVRESMKAMRGIVASAPAHGCRKLATAHVEFAPRRLPTST